MRRAVDPSRRRSQPDSSRGNVDAWEGGEGVVPSFFEGGDGGEEGWDLRLKGRWRKVRRKVSLRSSFSPEIPNETEQRNGGGMYDRRKEKTHLEEQVDEGQEEDDPALSMRRVKEPDEVERDGKAEEGSEETVGERRVGEFVSDDSEDEELEV